MERPTRAVTRSLAAYLSARPVRGEPPEISHAAWKMAAADNRVAPAVKALGSKRVGAVTVADFLAPVA